MRMDGWCGHVPWAWRLRLGGSWAQGREGPCVCVCHEPYLGRCPVPSANPANPLFSTTMEAVCMEVRIPTDQFTVRHGKSVRVDLGLTTDEDGQLDQPGRGHGPGQLGTHRLR